MLNPKKKQADAPGGMPDVVHAIAPEDVPGAPPGDAAGKPRKAHPVRRGVLITVLAFAAYIAATVAVALSLGAYVDGSVNECVIQLAFRLPLGLAACRLLRRGDRAVPVRKMRRGRFLAFFAAWLLLVQVPTQVAGYHVAGAAGLQAAEPFADMEPVADLLNTFLLAPIVEEIVVRGVFFALSRRFMGFWPSALTNTVLFTMMHSPRNMATAALHAPLYCMTYEATGRVRYGIALHFAFNALSLVPSMLLLPVVPVPLALAMGAAATAATVLLYAKRDAVTAWLVPDAG